MRLRAAAFRVATLAAGLGLAIGAGMAQAPDAPPPDDRPDLSAPSLRPAPVPHPAPQSVPAPQATPATPAAEGADGKAAAKLAAILDLFPPTGPGLVAYNQGVTALKARDFKKAREFFDTSINSAPGSAAAHAERGSAFIGLGDKERAIIDLTKALDLSGNTVNPTFRAHVLANRGVAYMNAKNYDQAVRDFDEALVFNKTMDFALMNRGYSYFQLKNTDAAISDLTKAILLNDKAEFTHTVRGYAYLDKKAYELASADFHKALALVPDTQGAILGLRQAYLAGKATEDGAKIRVVRAADPACEPTCAEWIAIEGKIETGSAETLRSVLKSIGKRQVAVFVDSGGGAVNDALEMGRMIRARGLDVVVTRTEFVTCGKDDKVCQKRTGESRSLGRPQSAGAVCASACGFLIAAGARRYVGPSSLVGVHQIVSFQTTQKVYRQYEVQRAVRNGKIVEIDRRVISEKRGEKKTVQTATDDETYVKVRKFFTEMGIDDSIMSLLISAPPKGMHWMTLSELKATGMMTDAANGEQLIRRGTIASVSLDGTPGGAVASASAGMIPLPTADPAAAALSETASLTRSIQTQLVRIGCNPGAEDGKWGQGVRRALERYNALTGKPLSTSSPSAETLAALTGRTGLVCPPACPPDLAEADGKCVAKDSDAAKALKKTEEVESSKPGKSSTPDDPKVRTASTGPERTDRPGRSSGDGQRSTDDSRPGNTCHNHESSCSGALSHCLGNCRDRTANANCQRDCNSAVQYCRSSGTWKTSNCLKTGMAH